MSCLQYRSSVCVFPSIRALDGHSRTCVIRLTIYTFMLGNMLCVRVCVRAPIIIPFLCLSLACALRSLFYTRTVRLCVESSVASFARMYFVSVRATHPADDDDDGGAVLCEPKQLGRYLGGQSLTLTHTRTHANTQLCDTECVFCLLVCARAVAFLACTSRLCARGSRE